MIMRMQSANSTKTGFYRNVSFMLVVYWGILVFWQNVSGAETRGTMDLLIKVGLMIYFVGFYLLRARTFNIKGLPVLLLAISLLITASTESTFSLGNLVSYAYPVIILFVVYGFGDNLQINRGQLLAFCKCVIGITLYAAIYAVIFCWDQFAGALSLNSAYGNELSSFFTSNFEYGMYLAAAIASAFLCLSMMPNRTIGKCLFYMAVIAIFAVNLILTFSRTSILSLAAFLIVYIVIGKKEWRKWLFLFAIIALLLFAIPTINRFVTEVVFKNDNMAGRDVLFEKGLLFYQDGSVSEKIFGFGVSEVTQHFEKHYDHSNVHNGYLQILLYYGSVGILFLLGFLLCQVIGSIKLIRRDRTVGTAVLGLNLSAILIMVTTTATIFHSTIDSYFLTAFFIITPKYIKNCVFAGEFYK